MVAISASDAAHRDRVGGEPNAVPLFKRPPEALRVCLYRDEPSAAPPAGRFRAGGAVPAPRLNPLLRLLTRTTSPLPCRARATGFAVLLSDARWNTVAYVELDGCRRALTDDGQLRQADGELVTALDTLFTS